jgi:hypothetical protein
MLQAADVDVGTGSSDSAAPEQVKPAEDASPDPKMEEDAGTYAETSGAKPSKSGRSRRARPSLPRAPRD